MPASTGAAIRAAREAKKLSVLEVSTRSKVSRPMIDEVERGKNVSVDTLEKIAKALGIKSLPIGETTLDISDAEAAHMRQLADRIRQDAAELVAAIDSALQALGEVGVGVARQAPRSLPTEELKALQPEGSKIPLPVTTLAAAQTKPKPSDEKTYDPVTQGHGRGAPKR
jgi:transcriptional regulator with XRE-family HTH domain